MYDGVFEPKQLQYTVTAQVTGQEIIAAPGVGKRIVIDRLIISGILACSASSFTILSGANIKMGPFYSSSPFIFNSGENFALLMNENEACNLTTTNSTANMTIFVQYHIQG